MDPSDLHRVQDQLSPQQVKAAPAPEDRRWPGPFMVLLCLVAVVWPVGGMVAALAAYLMADREQAFALLAVAVAALVLRAILGV